jgi:mannose-6-phosphate isomerase-like protein (cupin superfamily)
VPAFTVRLDDRADAALNVPMRMLLPRVALFATLICPIVGTSAIALGQTPAQTPPPAAPKPQAPAPRPKTPAPAAQAASRAVVLTVEVTDIRGQGQEGVKITTSGTVIREGTTDAGGILRFANMRPGDYRLRLEKDGFFTLERDVTLQPGKSIAVDITLSSAPKPPPPPPAPTAPVASAPVGPPGEPRVLSISDFLEKNLISREPMKQTTLGCSGVLQSTLLQIRDPLPDQTDDQLDQSLYVVAGQGTLKLGGRDTPLSAATFAVIPRGTSFGLTRKGGPALIVLLSRVNAPCGNGGQK